MIMLSRMIPNVYLNLPWGPMRARTKIGSYLRLISMHHAPRTTDMIGSVTLSTSTSTSTPLSNLVRDPSVSSSERMHRCLPASTPTSSVNKRCHAVHMQGVSHGLEARASAAGPNAMERAPALVTVVHQ